MEEEEEGGREGGEEMGWIAKEEGGREGEFSRSHRTRT